MQDSASPGFGVFDSLGIGVLVCAEPDLAVRFANTRAKTLFGPDLEGRPLGSIIPALVPGTVAETLSKGRPFILTGEIAPPSSGASPSASPSSPRASAPMACWSLRSRISPS